MVQRAIAANYTALLRTGKISTARNLVDFIGNAAFEAHRGAAVLANGQLVVFGNGGASAPRGKEEIALVRKRLNSHSLIEKDFALDSEGYSWCLVIDFPSPTLGLAIKKEVLVQELDDAVWEAWAAACDKFPLA